MGSKAPKIAQLARDLSFPRTAVYQAGLRLKDKDIQDRVLPFVVAADLAWELRYMRDAEKRELDFVVLKNNVPQYAVECKSGDKKLSPHIKYFAGATQIPIFYQVHAGEQDREISEHRSRLIPFAKFTLLKNTL